MQILVPPITAGMALSAPAFIAAAFVAIGLILVGYSLNVRRRAAASARWPISKGSVTSSKLANETEKDGDNEDYDGWWPEVRYVYSVAGSDYQGSRIRFGSVRFSTQEKAKALLAPYKEGAAVEVRYNPSDPRDSTLETVKPALGVPAFIGGVLLLIALAILA